MRVGFVGLGGIGTQMVKRALAAGHQVTVYARGAGLTDVVETGAAKSGNYAELAAASETLVLCVYNDDQLSDVLLAEGALAAMTPGSTVVLHTTGSPELARELGAEAPAGVRVIDACFSGGPDDTAAGKLTLMIGGDEAAIEAVTPLLSSYAVSIHRAGPLGSGQEMKLLNNLLFAANLRNAVEILRVAGEQGFESWTVARILRQCSGDSFALCLFEREVPMAAMLRGIRPYMEKDVATALTMASASGIDVEAFAETAAYFGPPAYPA